MAVGHTDLNVKVYAADNVGDLNVTMLKDTALGVVRMVTQETNVINVGCKNTVFVIIYFLHAML